MRVPTLAAINAAELRLLQSKRNVRQSVDRTRSALRAAVVRPSTLVLVALLSGISAFLVSHLLRPAVNSVPNSTDSTIRAPSYSLVRTFVSMYGARVLACALQLGVAAWKQSGVARQCQHAEHFGPRRFHDLQARPLSTTVPVRVSMALDERQGFPRKLQPDGEMQ